MVRILSEYIMIEHQSSVCQPLLHIMRQVSISIFHLQKNMNIGSWHTDFILSSLWTKTVGIGLKHEWVLTWGYTNDAMPEAYWQVCCRGSGHNSRLLMLTADRYWLLLKQGLVWKCWWLPCTACWHVGMCQAYSGLRPHSVTLWRSLTY